MESIVCDLESEECCSDDCSNCSTRVPSLNLMEGTNIDEEEEVSWTVWQTINTKVTLQTVSGLIESLLWEIDNRWPIFLHHAFTDRQQRKYIETIVSSQVQTIMSLRKLILRRITNSFGKRNHKVIIGKQIKLRSSHSILK